VSPPQLEHRNYRWAEPFLRHTFEVDVLECERGQALVTPSE